MIELQNIEAIIANKQQNSEQKSIEFAAKIARKTTLVTLSSGEIRTEAGADGLYLLFDCDCTDALPYCKAHCCGIKGTVVQFEELPELLGMTILNDVHDRYEMKRECDGLCCALDRDTRLCTVYDKRPYTCRDFHCSRGLQRGWKLNGISRVDY